MGLELNLKNSIKYFKEGCYKILLNLLATVVSMQKYLFVTVNEREIPFSSQDRKVSITVVIFMSLPKHESNNKEGALNLTVV